MTRKGTRSTSWAEGNLMGADSNKALAGSDEIGEIETRDDQAGE